jgi:hypothetical protein
LATLASGGSPQDRLLCFLVQHGVVVTGAAVCSRLLLPPLPPPSSTSTQPPPPPATGYTLEVWVADEVQMWNAVDALMAAGYDVADPAGPAPHRPLQPAWCDWDNAFPVVEVRDCLGRPGGPCGPRMEVCFLLQPWQHRPLSVATAWAVARVPRGVMGQEAGAAVPQSVEAPHCMALLCTLLPKEASACVVKECPGQSTAWAVLGPAREQLCGGADLVQVPPGKRLPPEQWERLRAGRAALRGRLRALHQPRLELAACNRIVESHSGPGDSGSEGSDGSEGSNSGQDSDSDLSNLALAVGLVRLVVQPFLDAVGSGGDAHARATAAPWVVEDASDAAAAGDDVPVCTALASLAQLSRSTQEREHCGVVESVRAVLCVCVLSFLNRACIAVVTFSGGGGVEGS